MNIFQRLFGKSKIEKESKTGIKIRSTVKPDEEPIYQPTGGNCIKLDIRNAKGQFIKGVLNPYIERDTVTGQFKKKSCKKK